MRRSVAAASVLIASLVPAQATARVLHTLVSPNEEQGGLFGYAVSGAGDVNGDGYDDVVVGAFLEDPGVSPADGGRVYVFDGATGSPLRELTSPHEAMFGSFGSTGSIAGDVDADGYPDVVVGAYLEGPDTSPQYAGRAYVFSGQTGAVVHVLNSPNPVSWSGFGVSVSGAGDVDADGYDDVIVGAWQEDPGGSPVDAGRAYVYDGETGAVLHSLASPNEQEGGQFGYSVSRAGDVNGDGYDDVIVGGGAEAPAPSPQYAGRAYVFDGESGGLIYALASPNEEPGGYFGMCVSGGEDVSGSGWPDVVVGASGEDWGAGMVYVFDGQTGECIHTLVSPDYEKGSWFGVASCAGDADGDGCSDVIVGAALTSPGASPDSAGRAYVFAPSILSADPVRFEPGEPWLAGPCPNPATGHVSLMLGSPLLGVERAALGLYDVSGRLIDERVIDCAPAGPIRRVSWTADGTLTPGVYWWRLRAGGQEARRRMVLVR